MAMNADKMIETVFNELGCHWFKMAWFIQSSAVITRSSIVRYHINNFSNWVRTSIRCWIHKRQEQEQRASYGVSFVNICEKIDRVITAPHCICIFVMMMMTALSLTWFYKTQWFGNFLRKCDCHFYNNLSWCILFLRLIEHQHRKIHCPEDPVQHYLTVWLGGIR